MPKHSTFLKVHSLTFYHICLYGEYHQRRLIKVITTQAPVSSSSHSLRPLSSVPSNNLHFKMSYFVRVYRNQIDAAMRHLTQMQNADNARRLVKRSSVHLKPSEYRRRRREENIRRLDRQSLYANLRTIYARKSRGF